jgi:hypothetical protein
MFEQPATAIAKADVRNNEGYNSLLGHLVDQAPAIGLPLLSARAQLKKALGIGVRGVSLRWSHLRPRADSVLTDLHSGVGDSNSVSSDPGRWGSAPEIPLPDEKTFQQKYHECLPAARIGPDIKWASPYQLVLGRLLTEPRADAAIFVHDKAGKKTLSLPGPSRAGLELWFCAAKNHSMCYLVQLVTEECPEHGLIAQVKLPLVIKSSRALFLAYHDEIQIRRDRQKRAVTLHKLTWLATRASQVKVFAKVALRGDIVVTLGHHRPRARRVVEPGVITDVQTGAEGTVGSGAAPGASSGGSGSGLFVNTDTGEVEYDQNLLDALAEELVRLEAHDEAAEQFGEWLANDDTETEQDGDGISNQQVIGDNQHIDICIKAE